MNAAQIKTARAQVATGTGVDRRGLLVSFLKLAKLLKQNRNLAAATRLLDGALAPSRPRKPHRAKKNKLHKQTADARQKRAP